MSQNGADARVELRGLGGKLPTAPLQSIDRDRVTIEAEQRTPNGQGGYTTGWSPVATVWAEVIGLNGNEAMRASIERSVSLYRVNLRKRDDVSAANRLRWNGRVLSITSVLPHPQEPRTALQLLCETSAGPVVQP
jgi:SPP1 family predicted phage head-tail adaptor